MSPLPANQATKTTTAKPETLSFASIFNPPERGWIAAKLPELATSGFPLSPTFIMRQPSPALESAPSTSSAPILPFGFHYQTPKTGKNQPVIDLSRGYYDPHTQTYTVPMRAGGDTIDVIWATRFWTGLDGVGIWDVVTDVSTD